MQTPLDVELVRLPGSRCGCELAHMVVYAVMSTAAEQSTDVLPWVPRCSNSATSGPSRLGIQRRLRGSRQDGAPSPVSPLATTSDIHQILTGWDNLKLRHAATPSTPPWSPSGIRIELSSGEKAH